MPFDWKRSIFVGIGFGVGVAIAGIAALGLIYWYNSRPPSWDATTVKGLAVNVSQTFNFNEQTKEFHSSGFAVTFLLQNNGSKDFTVPQDFRLFERSKKTGALEELTAKLDHSFVVPAKDKAEVHMDVDYGCTTEDLASGKTTERDGATCFKDDFGDVDGFVGFDDATHTRVDLPKPVFYGGESSK